MSSAGRTHASYRHGVLVHDTDEQLLEAVLAFVARGLAAGGEVLVVSPRDRAEGARALLGSHPRLEHGVQEDLYQQPARTLFAYQRKLAQRSEATEVWVTSPVPLGHDLASQTAWHRYESAVDDALGAYPFVGLCTYDTRTRPADVIAAALATHRTVNVDLTDRDNHGYVEPAAFLTRPLAGRPAPPDLPPATATFIGDLDELAAARRVLRAAMLDRSAVSAATIERFRIAVNEVAVNGLLHGHPPVRVTLWAAVGSLTCLVEDSGAGELDPMTGYRHPVGSDDMGLWVVRQLVDDVVIDNPPSGGCRVLLSVTERPV